MASNPYYPARRVAISPYREATEGYKRFLKAGSKRTGKYTAEETGAGAMARARFIQDINDRFKELQRQKSDRYLGRIT